MIDRLLLVRTFSTEDRPHIAKDGFLDPLPVLAVWTVSSTSVVFSQSCIYFTPTLASNSCHSPPPSVSPFPITSQCISPFSPFHIVFPSLYNCEFACMNSPVSLEVLLITNFFFLFLVCTILIKKSFVKKMTSKQQGERGKLKCCRSSDSLSNFFGSSGVKMTGQSCPR